MKTLRQSTLRLITNEGYVVYNNVEEYIQQNEYYQGVREEVLSTTCDNTIILEEIDSIEVYQVVGNSILKLNLINGEEIAIEVGEELL